MEQLRVACGGIRWPTVWLTSERAFRWSAEGPLSTRQTRKHPPQDPLRWPIKEMRNDP